MNATAQVLWAATDERDRRGDASEGPAVLDAARTAVRALLLEAPGFAAADPHLRRTLASRMVNVALLGADLAAEDLGARRRPSGGSRPTAVAQGQPRTDFQAVKQASGAIAATRQALDFPNYVTSLINGVFKAITTSNLQQLTAIAEMLDNVTSSASDFSMRSVGDDEVGRWTVGRFPFFALGDNGELSVKDGVELSEQHETLKNGLDLTEDQTSSIDDSDLAATLLPFARAKMGRDRQQILGTMVQMGLQRIVVDEGQIHASMDMRVDARSIAQGDHAKEDAAAVAASASGGGAVGPFSGSASMSASFSHVESDREMTKDELAVRAGLRSSVDLAFRTEQIPLDRLANDKARVKLNATARVPVDVSSTSALPADSGAAMPSLPTRPVAPTAPAAAPPPSKKEEPKKDETKKDETKKDDPKKEEQKKDEPKKDATGDGKATAKPDPKAEPKKDNASGADKASGDGKPPGAAKAAVNKDVP